VADFHFAQLARGGVRKCVLAIWENLLVNQQAYRQIDVLTCRYAPQVAGEEFLGNWGGWSVLASLRVAFVLRTANTQGRRKW
jgi:hypothetical protein